MGDWAPTCTSRTEQGGSLHMQERYSSSISPEQMSDILWELSRDLLTP